jgi:hypothetical protein
MGDLGIKPLLGCVTRPHPLVYYYAAGKLEVGAG